MELCQTAYHQRNSYFITYGDGRTLYQNGSFERFHEHKQMLRVRESDFGPHETDIEQIQTEINRGIEVLANKSVM